jgi:hypothetical protein
MTNKEIKLELAKAALQSCRLMTSEDLTSSIKNVYDWIVEDDKEKEQPEESSWRSDDISKIVKYVDAHCPNPSVATRLDSVFALNNINTVHDLLMGYSRNTFKKLRNVGQGCLSYLDAALKELYGLSDW